MEFKDDNRSILIIDGMNVFIRHMMVNETVNASGEPYGGAVGFLRFLHNIVSLIKPKLTVVCWEQGGGCSKRKKILPEYKEKRAKVAKGSSNYLNELENKIKQLQFLSNAITKLPILQLYVPDVEGDDIVAYIAKYPFKNEKTVVVSSDTDLYQLLGERIETVIYNPATKSFVNKTDVKTKTGIHANNYCIAKAIVGDKSDGIPGVQGLHFTRLVSLIPEFAEEKELYVEDVLKLVSEKFAQTKKPTKTLQTLAEEITDTLKRNWKLMYLDTNILSSDQIQKINARINEFEPKLNTIEFMRCFSDIYLALDRYMLNGLADYCHLIINKPQERKE